MHDGKETRRVLKIVKGQLILTEVEDTEAEKVVEELSVEEELSRIDQAKKTVESLQVPDYVPDEVKLQVEKLILKHCAEVMEKAIQKWKNSSVRTTEALVKEYDTLLSHSFLVADTLRPAADPYFITENTFAVTNNGVEVKNVVNCTGVVLKTKSRYIAFHILGFAEVDAQENPIHENDRNRVEQNIEEMVGLLDESPLSVVVHASTLGKGIGTLDAGHEFVAKQLQVALHQRFPETYSKAEDVEIEKVRSLDFGLREEE